MGRKQVLIVEDNFDNREIYRQILQHAGYQVIEATNGEEGVRLARENLPDLILMDLSMPVLDGWGAIEQLKQGAETGHIPVCALSAHVVLGGDYRRAISAGFVSYLTKPIEPKQVLQEIQHWIGTAGVGPQ